MLQQLHFTYIHTTELVDRGEKKKKGLSGVKDSEFIAAKILEGFWTWSREVKVNNLLICLASVLRIGMKNVSKEKTEESVSEVWRIA